MSIAYRISGYNRRRKWNLFLEKMKPDIGMKVLDVGFAENEHSSTANFLEKHYPYLHNVTALGIEAPQQFRQRYPQVKAVCYDGQQFPFADQEFDLGWSNAVLEHVGARERQIVFLQELKRVTKAAFISTPNKYFPIEVHTRTLFWHYLPKKMFDRYLVLVGHQWATGDYMNLLSLRDIQRLLLAAGITEFTVIKNKLLFFTLDFVIIF